MYYLDHLFYSALKISRLPVVLVMLGDIPIQESRQTAVVGCPELHVQVVEEKGLHVLNGLSLTVQVGVELNHFRAVDRG